MPKMSHTVQCVLWKVTETQVGFRICLLPQANLRSTVGLQESDVYAPLDVPLSGLLYLAHSFLSLPSLTFSFSFQAKTKKHTLRPHGAVHRVRRVEKGLSTHPGGHSHPREGGIDPRLHSKSPEPTLINPVRVMCLKTEQSPWPEVEADQTQCLLEQSVYLLGSSWWPALHSASSSMMLRRACEWQRRGLLKR